MKVRIDGRAWLPAEELGQETRARLRDALTIQPRQTSEHAKANPPITLYREVDGWFGVPRGFFDKHVTGKHVYDVCVAEGGAMGPGVSASLFQGDTDGKYAEQNTAVAAMVQHLTAKPWGGGILQAPTGTGKTIMGLRIAAELGRRTLIVVNKGFFLRQWSDRIRQVFPMARVGIVQGPKCQHEGMDFVIGMVHTLSQRDFPDSFYRSFGTIITDECFPAGTMVETVTGPVQIQDVSVGDQVLNAVGVGEVSAVGSRLVDLYGLRLVELGDGREIVVTKEHPFLTEAGFITADRLADCRLIAYDDCIDLVAGHVNLPDVRSELLREVRSPAEVLLTSVLRRGQAASATPMPRVRKGLHGEGQEDVLLQSLREHGPQPHNEQPGHGDFNQGQSAARREPFAARGGISQDAAGEPDESGGCQGARLRKAGGDGPRSSSARRERSQHDDSAATASGCAGPGMVWGVLGPDRSEARDASAILQDRCGEPSAHDCSGSGREDSQLLEGKAVGQQEVCLPGGARVVRVSVPERADLDRLGVRPEGDHGRYRVYNLSVTGHPSYVLTNGKFVVHNCHRIGAPSWSDVIPLFPAARRLGLTATPRRKDGAQDVFLHHIGDISYRLTSEPMVPFIRRLSAPFEPGPIRQYGKDIEPGNQSSSQLVSQLVADPFYNRALAVDVSKAIAAGRKVLVVSERMDHLWTLHTMVAGIISRLGHEGTYTYSFATGQQYVLDDAGDRVEVRKKVGTKTVVEHKTRSTTDEDLDQGEEAKVVWATKQMVEEGFDIPALDVLVLATPMSDVEQIVGRVRRWCKPQPDKCFRLCSWRAGSCKGKPDPIVVDVRTPDWAPYMGKARRREIFYDSVGAKYSKT